MKNTNLHPPPSLKKIKKNTQNPLHKKKINVAFLHSRVDTNLLQFAFKPNHRGPQKKGEIQMFKKRVIHYPGDTEMCSRSGVKCVLCFALKPTDCLVPHVPTLDILSTGILQGKLDNGDLE